MAIEKKRGGRIVERIISDVNKAVETFEKKKYLLDPEEFEKEITDINSSVEAKKKALMQELDRTIIKTFSINMGKITKEELVSSLKTNIPIIKKIVRKINSLNHYLETTFLDEIAAIKKELKKSKTRNWLNKKKVFSKEMNNLEKTVYKLITKIIILDNKLAKRFEKKEKEIAEESNINISDLEDIISVQKELMYHMEAKLPAKIDSKLTLRPNFDYWVAAILALLARVEEAYSKEEKIFGLLTKETILKEKIGIKIKYLMKEKTEALRLAEGRLLMADKLAKMDYMWKKQITNWMAASEL